MGNQQPGGGGGGGRGSGGGGGPGGGQGGGGGAGGQDGTGRGGSGGGGGRGRAPAMPSRPAIAGRRKKTSKGPEKSFKLPAVVPHGKCKLRLLKLERIHDWLLMEEEFLKKCNVEIEAKARKTAAAAADEDMDDERSKVELIRGMDPIRVMS
ncbi:unnamed protein product [Medioppia subpectinata]|uniref:Uncharacterized protein n=1 Tax=Medioppia subpectinata TaxID=1979941 RepID=A0A7R9Q528_9ACAR|nr:unnamed protein product [Medioppia subpectinata]CAG2112886.1 unnamed protein product [Medioppia subpectinata]